MQNIISRIFDYTLEDIMGDRFGDYAKSIIQDRALPDVRDGLKPVQRRILYAMYRNKNTYDKPYKKSATAVGDVMGKYHPHGDSSIYEAMVRMSQWWKQNATYIDMHGNNGSMDGDSAAAMRYTEARLSKITNENLKDIDKNTIEFAPNFDDTLLEPIVLPAKYPNLLVNGANGISAGYATNIPPHNLGEVIDATVKRIDNPTCRLETLLNIVKGPDFPTGGIVEGKKGILEAYQTGKGKIVVKSKIEFIKDKTKEQILVTEIPFDVNKELLRKRIGEIIIDKKIDGMTAIRDESDRENPVRIVIDLKKGANKEFILNYLLKNTDLQITYSFNMVAIVNRRPMTIGLLPILDAFIDHQKEVITRRTEFDLKHAKERIHIVEGLVRAVAIMDEIIAVIRASKNRSDAKKNLIEKFGFTDRQAEAIITLQLYRLTNVDVIELEEEHKKLQMIIKALEEILSDEEKLKGIMKEELKRIKKEYATPRRTEIQDEITEIKIDATQMIPQEDVIVLVTKEGYVKRTSLRSYDENVESAIKEGDYIIGKYKMSTMDTILLFTDLGNYLYVPVHELPDLKWKDLGKHISNLITIRSNEQIIASLPVYEFDDTNITLFTEKGMTKRTSLKDFKVQRYSKPMVAIKLKEDDRLLAIDYHDYENVFIVTKKGYGLTYKTEEIPVTGIKASGVKAINLKNDVVVSAMLYHSDFEYVTIITEKGTGKRIRLTEFEFTSRARKGVQVIREVKTNPYYIVKAFIVGYKAKLQVQTGKEFLEIKLTDLPIADRYATGTSFSKDRIIDSFLPVMLVEETTKKEVKIEKENIELDNIDKKMMTIDDFLDNLDTNE